MRAKVCSLGLMGFGILLLSSCFYFTMHSSNPHVCIEMGTSAQMNCMK